MSDSEDETDSGGQTVSLAGFLFGNIDTKTGQLEGDVLDEEAQRHLNALQKLGLGSMMDQVMEEGAVVASKPQKKTKFSYDDSDSDEDDEDSEVAVDSASSKSKLESANKGYTQDIDDDYDEGEKSPSAQDFFDITELAEEDLSASVRSLSTSQDTTDYDEDEGSLMPPPPVPPPKGVKTSSSNSNDNSSEKKLETPLAAMMPSKYVGVNITDVFPDFRPDKILRFARLFGLGKSSNLPQWWRNVRKRRRKKRAAESNVEHPEDLTDERRDYGWEWHYGDEPGDINDMTAEEVGSVYNLKCRNLIV